MTEPSKIAPPAQGQPPYAHEQLMQTEKTFYTNGHLTFGQRLRIARRKAGKADLKAVAMNKEDWAAITSDGFNIEIAPPMKRGRPRKTELDAVVKEYHELLPTIARGQKKALRLALAKKHGVSFSSIETRIFTKRKKAIA